MTERSAQARMMASPFVASFIGKCRPGNLDGVDLGQRAASWGNWAIESLDVFKGLSEREYMAIVLPGKFYDPNGNGPVVRPHLEIPQRVIDQSAEEFPERLAATGMALLFPWWLVPEVTAVRRAVFPASSGSALGLLNALGARRQGMEAAYRGVAGQVEENWGVFEAMLAANPELLLDDVCGGFSTQEISEVLAPAAGLGLTIYFDAKLLESQGKRAARRVGVWQIHGQGAEGKFAMGAVTPRMTFNSIFKDPLFDIAKEGDAALLVRLLVLRRLVANHLTSDLPGAVTLDPSESTAAKPFLRAVVARVGAKLPEASEAAAVHFLQTHREAGDAWAALERWAGDKYLLTVTREAFFSAHNSAFGRVRRAETPTRSDIDTVLPLAWHDGKVVRVTFTRPEAGDN